MTDYSQLSDFEINHRVAKLIGLKLQSSESLLYNTQGKWEIFDPCCNPADAWPIISENKISTMWMTSEKEWCAWSEGDLADGTWDWENVPDYYFNCTSQLRAAMIVFLMMKDAENAPAI